MVDVTPKEAITAGRSPAASSGCSPDDCEDRKQCDQQGRRPRRGADRGIQAAKRTPDLIPSATVAVGSVYENFTFGDDFVEVETQAKASIERASKRK